MKLNKIPVGRTARIQAYDSTLSTQKCASIKSYRQKCLYMGLTPGTTFKVIGIAPLGCPIEIEVRGYALSLRSQESEVLVCELL